MCSGFLLHFLDVGDARCRWRDCLILAVAQARALHQSLRVVVLAPRVVGGVFRQCNYSATSCSVVELRVILGVSCLTCSCHLLSAFRALWYPGEQERRARIMLCLFFVSYGATLLPSELTVVIPDQQQFFNVSVVLLRFNGLGNVLAYSLNSYLARSTVVARDMLRERDSGERDFVEWACECNVRVVFDIWNHEQQLVPGVQHLSMRRSEEEIRSLEAARGTQGDSDA